MPITRFPVEGLSSPERKVIEQDMRDVPRIIAERQNATEAEWAKSTWRSSLVADMTSPQRITPRFRCKTPSWGGPLYADRPLFVPLPAGIQHEGFQQTNFLGDARKGAARPPLPRRLPAEMPVVRQGESPRWKTTQYEHTYAWRF